LSLKVDVVEKMRRTALLDFSPRTILSLNQSEGSAMFLRRYERRAKGGRRTYWALVESVRTGKIAEGWWHSASWHEASRAAVPQSRSLSGSSGPRGPCSIRPHYDDPSDEEPVLVRLRDVRFERLRDFGDVWMAWGLWRLLGLDKLLDGLTPAGREEVAWPVVAAILTIARFCEPQSELHIESTWYRGTALEDLLGVSPEKIHTDRLYEGLDRLLPHKAAIEKHLKDRLGDLFDLDYDLLLYDVTSTYFEGQCKHNPLAQRGYSRDGRPDCLQVCIGLVVTEDGIPLGYEVFAGNRPRLDDGGRNRRGDGEEVRPGASRLGDGPRDGQRGEFEVSARAGRAVYRGHAQGHAAAVRRASDGEGLA
jgi:hypothetical protein